MNESIKTISDKNQFESIFREYFAGHDAFLKTKSGDIKVQFLGFSQENVAFRIPRVKNAPEVLVLFARKNDLTVYANLKTIENNEDTFIFLPVKFQIIAMARREDRTNINEGSKNIIYISNVLSDTIIHNILALNEKKIDKIKETITGELKSKFDKIRIVMLNEMKYDLRLKFLQETRIPIHITNINDKQTEKNELLFNRYINEIYAKDYKLSGQKDIISEIAVPIMYRGIITYGYVQVNHSSALGDPHLSVVKRLAIYVSEHLTKENFFQSSQEKFLVYDISKKGIGIVFRDRRQLSNFPKDHVVCVDVLLPSQKKVIAGAIVRNITFLDNAIIKVGLELVSMDAISEVNYEEYFDEKGETSES